MVSTFKAVLCISRFVHDAVPSQCVTQPSSNGTALERWGRRKLVERAYWGNSDLLGCWQGTPQSDPCCDPPTSMC
jgi:hypothetical protein